MNRICDLQTSLGKECGREACRGSREEEDRARMGVVNRDFCLSMVFRILHEVPLRGIRLMYVRERDEGRRGRRKGDGEGIVNYL